jgi:hypothetical protein
MSRRMALSVIRTALPTASASGTTRPPPAPLAIVTTAGTAPGSVPWRAAQTAVADRENASVATKVGPVTAWGDMKGANASTRWRRTATTRQTTTAVRTTRQSFAG